MEDRDLLKHVDAFLLPFKMTIFLRKGFSDAYLDLATIIYQIRTRIKRFTEKVFLKLIFMLITFHFRQML